MKELTIEPVLGFAQKNCARETDSGWQLTRGGLISSLPRWMFIVRCIAGGLQSLGVQGKAPRKEDGRRATGRGVRKPPEVVPEPTRTFSSPLFSSLRAFDQSVVGKSFLSEALLTCTPENHSQSRCPRLRRRCAALLL